MAGFVDVFLTLAIPVSRRWVDVARPDWHEALPELSPAKLSRNISLVGSSQANMAANQPEVVLGVWTSA